MVKFSHCREGDTVTVIRVEGTGPFRKRLLEMGIMRGTELTIVKYAPLKDPLELVLMDYHLTLRVEEAEKIMVHVPTDAVQM